MEGLFRNPGLYQPLRMRWHFQPPGLQYLWLSSMIPLSFWFWIVKAYIPLRRKNICVGSWRWLRPPTPEFCVGDTDMLVSKNTKTPDAKLKICVTQTQNFRIGHVHFMFFVLISFAFGKPIFQWNMGLRLPPTVENRRGTICKCPLIYFDLVRWLVSGGNQTPMCSMRAGFQVMYYVWWFSECAHSELNNSVGLWTNQYTHKDVILHYIMGV